MLEQGSADAGRRLAEQFAPAPGRIANCIIPQHVVNIQLHVVSEMKRLRIEIGDDLGGFATLVRFAADGFLKHKFHLQFGNFASDSELLALAEEGDIDIFILYMNNVRSLNGGGSRERVESASLLIEKLKCQYGRQIIACSSFDDSWEPVVHAKRFADVYLSLPFKMEELRAAVTTCVDNLSDH